MTEVSVEVPINIALIKYWGKRNEELILPLNDSISINIDALTATTTISLGEHLDDDSVEINGKHVDVKDGTRFARVFKEARRRSNELGKKANWHVHVRSQTNFPVAAGLASSAAGFAAISCGIGHALQLSDDEIVHLARIGSGSACRSVKSGFVHWRAGAPSACTDGGCHTIAAADHWPELRVVVVVLDDKAKAVSSSVGMRSTVATSTLLKARVCDVVPQRVEALKTAIALRDFGQLAKITMSESNQLHAVCMDTYPPLQYLNEDSRRLIDFVHAFNAYYDAAQPHLAYTFDAGSNCCLLMEAATLPTVLSSLHQCFSFDLAKITKTASCGSDMNSGEFSHNTSNVGSTVRGEMSEKKDVFAWPSLLPLDVRFIVCSTVGMGPRLLYTKNDDTMSSA